MLIKKPGHSLSAYIVVYVQSIAEPRPGQQKLHAQFCSVEQENDRSITSFNQRSHTCMHY